MIARGLEWIGTGLIHLKNETSLIKLYLFTATEGCVRLISRFGTGDEMLERCWKVW